MACRFNLRAVFPKAPFFRTTAARADVVLTARLPHQGLPAQATTRPVSSQLFYTASIGSLPGRDEFRASGALASRRRHCAQPPPPLQPVSAPARPRPPPRSSVVLLIFLDNRVGVRAAWRPPLGCRLPTIRSNGDFLFSFFFHSLFNAASFDLAMVRVHVARYRNGGCVGRWVCVDVGPRRRGVGEVRLRRRGC